MSKLVYAFTWLTGGNSALGGWDTNVVTGAMPQKVATAVGDLGETLLGAAYNPIAYLGSKQVNGVLHAVLAEQILVTGVDQHNIVILQFLEKGTDCSLYSIETVLEGGAAFGGLKVDPKVGDEMPAEAIEVFNKVTAVWFGATLHPVAYLGGKMTKGMNNIFLATVTAIAPNAKASVKLIVVNGVMNSIDFIDVL